jgi:hypothetical protein
LSYPGKPERKDICDLALPNEERAMGEVEFDRLLDAVQAAIGPVPGDEIMLTQYKLAKYGLARLSDDKTPAKAANDNETVWPLIPFPEGWYAAS